MKRFGRAVSAAVTVGSCYGDAKNKDGVVPAVQFSSGNNAQKLRETNKTLSDIAGQVPLSKRQPPVYPQP